MTPCAIICTYLSENVATNAQCPTTSCLLYYRQKYPINCKHSYWVLSVSRLTLPRWPSGQGVGLVTRKLGVLISVEAHFFFIFHLFIYFYFDVLHLPTLMYMHFTYFPMTALHVSIRTNLRKACTIFKILAIRQFLKNLL